MYSIDILFAKGTEKMVTAVVAKIGLWIAHATGRDQGFVLLADFAHKHGPKSLPPIDNLKKLVEEWIGKAVWFNEKITLKLFVSSYRIPRDNFVGVRILGFRPNTENQNSLELIMGLPGHDYKFRGYLDCGQGNTAASLLHITRPALANYLLICKTLLAHDEVSTPTKLIAQESSLNQIGKKWRYLLKRANLRSLSAALLKSANDNNGKISQVELNRILGLNGIDTKSSDDTSSVIAELITSGVIYPQLISGYETTEITQEYANEWRLSEIAKEKAILEASQVNFQRTLSHSERKLADLKRQLKQHESIITATKLALLNSETALAELREEESKLF